jgi:glycosyltransferase involved in cell wall biosynthesis
MPHCSPVRVSSQESPAPPRKSAAGGTRGAEFPVKKLKVLLLAHSCQVRHEGQQKAQRLGSLPGIDLRVIVPDRWFEYGKWRETQWPERPSYSFQQEPVRWPWSGPGQWYLHYYPKLARTLRSFRPDVIDIWEEPWGLVSVHACWLRRRILPASKVISETEANINRQHPFPFNKFRRYTLKHADFAVSRNAEGVNVLRANGYRGDARVVGNGVDAELFRPLDRQACKHALGLSGFVAGYVGRIIEAKGLMDMIEAAALCAADINLVFVGSGDFQSALERRASELGLSERVRFLAPRPMRELPEVMNAMDTLLLVSRTTRTWKEQFGRVIIEAHGCGTPVIGSDSGGIPEVVGEGGLIVPEENPARLAEALTTLYRNPDLAATMGQRGRHQVENKYTWERLAEQMRDIYLGLVP